MYSYDLSGKNKYYTLYELLRGDILRGKIRAGEKLPSKRALAADLGVSVVTVQTAYDQLLAEGYVASRERSGYFVCPVDAFVHGERPSAPAVKVLPKREFAADFVNGSTPPGLFPFSSWAKLMREVLSDCGEHTAHLPVASLGDGHLQLADAVLKFDKFDLAPPRLYAVVQHHALAKLG